MLQALDHSSYMTVEIVSSWTVGCLHPMIHPAPWKKHWISGALSKKAQYGEILLTLIQLPYTNICSCSGAELLFPFQPESMVMTLNVLNQVWHAQSFVWKVPLIFLAISKKVCFFLKGVFSFAASHSKLLAMADVSPACLSAETGGANDCFLEVRLHWFKLKQLVSNALRSWH